MLHMVTLSRGIRRPVRRCGLLSAVAVGILLVTSCSSDSKPASPAATAAPEECHASDADVTAGLGRMTTSAAKIAATVAAGSKVEHAQDQLEVDWEQIEGTFKGNEPDLYLQVEDAMTAIDNAAADGNSADTATATEDLDTAIRSYLAEHP